MPDIGVSGRCRVSQESGLMEVTNGEVVAIASMEIRDFDATR